MLFTVKYSYIIQSTDFCHECLIESKNILLFKYNKYYNITESYQFNQVIIMKYMSPIQLLMANEQIWLSNHRHISLRAFGYYYDLH